MMVFEVVAGFRNIIGRFGCSVLDLLRRKYLNCWWCDLLKMKGMELVNPLLCPLLPLFAILYENLGLC
jgi:hypothetical protein